MVYKPTGVGVLVSFDAKWKSRLGLGEDKGKLKTDFGNMIKNRIGQQHPSVYMEAFYQGDNSATYSLYFEVSGAKKEGYERITEYEFGRFASPSSLDKVAVREIINDFLRSNPAVGLSNFNLREVELKMVKKAYGSVAVSTISR